MGTKLMQYYDYITKEMGAKGQIKLAMKTKLPSTKAAMADDSDETVAKFKAAIAELTGKDAPEL